jgi:hypothetical protein
VIKRYSLVGKAAQLISILLFLKFPKLLPAVMGSSLLRTCSAQIWPGGSLGQVRLQGPFAINGTDLSAVAYVRARTA